MWRCYGRNSILFDPRSSLFCHLASPPVWSFPPQPHALGKLCPIETIFSRRNQGFAYPLDLNDLGNHLRRRSLSPLCYYCPRSTSASKEQHVSVCASSHQMIENSIIKLKSGLTDRFTYDHLRAHPKVLSLKQSDKLSTTHGSSDLWILNPKKYR